MSANRRAPTYGKKSKHVFSSDFGALTLGTPKKTPAHLMSVSPIARAHADSGGGDIFDVPVSDDEHDAFLPGSPTPRRRSPAKSLPRGLPSPIKRIKQASANDSVNATKSTTAAGKRKRTPSASNPRQPSRATTPHSAKSPRPTRPRSVEPKETVNGTRSQRSTTPSERQPLQAAAKKAVDSKFASAKRRQATKAAPSVVQSVVETIEEAPEDVFDFPGDDTKLITTPVKQRPQKIQKVERITTPTPPSIATPSRSTPSSARVTTTPRQANLWSTLLNDDSFIEDIEPDVDVMSRKATPRAKALPRARLIDTLKVSELESEADVSDSEAEAQQRHVHFSQDSQLAPSAMEDVQPASQSAGPKITYAQQRSYLQDEPQTLEELLSQPLDLGLSPAVGKTTTQVTQLGFSDEEEDDAGGPMKSIHELRAAGDERRFDDDMNALIDDISTKDKAGLSGKRSALMELFKKLRDTKLRNRFVSRSLEFEVFNRCQDEKDPIAGSALCAILIEILAEPSDSRSAQLAFEANVISTLMQMLDNARDLQSIAKDRKTNMSRIAQANVVDMIRLFDPTSFWKTRMPKAVAPQMLGLRALELLMRRLRESRLTKPILNAEIVSKLIPLLEIGTQACTTVPYDPNAAALISLDTTLSTLESGSIAPSCALDATIWPEPSLSHIRDATTTLLGLANLDLADTKLLALRLTLNLANNSARNAEIFTTAPLLGQLLTGIDAGFASLSDIVDTPPAFDDLVLRLGAAFNLAEMSPRARALAAEHHAPHLRRMAAAFAAGRAAAADADSLEKSQANVAHGYLAVLLGNLSLDERARGVVCEALPGRGAGLLVEAVTEFIGLHEAVDRQGESEVWASFTGRLQAVADRLRG